MRQAARHFSGYRADYFLVLAGDHLYRMDFAEVIDSHVERNADITIAAQPVPTSSASEMGIFLFIAQGQIAGFEGEARRGAPREDRPEHPGRLGLRRAFGREAVRGVDGHLRLSRDVLLDVLSKADATDFGREIIPSALGQHRVNAYLYNGYWADVGTVNPVDDATCC